MNRLMRSFERLYRVEVRSLVPIFAGAVLLLIAVAFIAATISGIKKRKALEAKRMQQEQQLKEDRRLAEKRRLQREAEEVAARRAAEERAREAAEVQRRREEARLQREAEEEAARRAAEEKRRQAAEARRQREAEEAAAERRAAEKRKRQELEAQKQREAEEQRRREQFAFLERVGVRSMPLASTPTEFERSIGTWLELQTEPAGAEVFLDWQTKGRTPLYLNAITLDGFLVVAKDGHEAAFRKISYRDNDQLHINLPPQSEPPKNRLLLIATTAAPSELFIILRGHFHDRGFTVLGPEDALEFQRIEQTVGDFSHRALRAWTRSKFNTGLVVKANVRDESRDVGKQIAVLGDTIRSNVKVNLDVYEVLSGKHLAHITGNGSAFALGKEKSFATALIQASDEAVQKMSAQFIGG